MTLITPSNSSTSSLSKTEKAAFDAELLCEQRVKASLLAALNKIHWMTTIVKHIADRYPQLLEPSLGCLGRLLYPLVIGGGWIQKELAALLYELSKCCHVPLGRFGPLLISTLFYMENFEMVDKNWCIPKMTDLHSALARHLEADLLLGGSTLEFALPVLLMLFERTIEFDLDKAVIQKILSALAANFVTPLNGDDFHLVLSKLCVLTGMAPGIGATINSTVSRLVQSTAITPEQLKIDTLVKFLQGPSDLERRFGLYVITCLSERYKGVLAQSISLQLWIAINCCDPVLSVATLNVIENLYEQDQSVLFKSGWKEILKVASSQDYDMVIGHSAGRALLKALKIQSDPKIFKVLEEIYRNLYRDRLPDMVSARTSRVDLTLVSRERLTFVYVTLARALEGGELAQDDYYPVIPSVLEFFLKEAFFDVAESVKEKLLNAADHLVGASLSDKVTVDLVAKTFDTFLSAPGQPNEEYDRVRVYAVILLARVAERFPPEDIRRLTLLKSLNATLVTPSESVQIAVSDAMAMLFPSIDAPTTIGYLEGFMTSMTTGKTLAIRRGAAYGLGALVKGRGSHIMKEQNILGRLSGILYDRTATLEAKQGSLFGLELIAKSLGHCFEPYIVKLLNALIGSFADGKIEIRQASLEAAQAMMSTVTSLGAKILLPVLLGLIDSTSWRSKVGAIEWLGAMAALAPKVLARQLSFILPKLVDSLTDSHYNVQRASREALYRYGAVIRNPEIRSLSSVIMEALANPPQFTGKCLESILHTAFAHVIDGPSLALLEPVLVRALRDRAVAGTEVKKQAAQILGNLATNLVDPRDLEMVLPGLVPALVGCLSDPVPEVRAHCGKVIGILVHTVGERHQSMSALSNDLFSIIGDSGVTSVDRAGAAQALAEILAARGPAPTKHLLEGSLLAGLASSKAIAREGYIMLIGFLPVAFDARGTLPELYEAGMRNLISQSLVLLADDNEAVREAANGACHAMVAKVALIDHVAIFDLLVEALSDSRWRCRLGCLKLFQEFLSKFSQEESSAAVDSFTMPTAEELAEGGVDSERIRLLMSKAFLYRFDGNSSAIRHHALTIWKGLAGHPLRAINTILPVFVEECCSLVEERGEGNPINLEEGRQVVYKAMEDMLCKVGDRIIEALLERIAELEEDYPVGSLYVATVAAKLLGGGSFPGINNTLVQGCIPKFIQLLQIGLSATEDETKIQAGQLFGELVGSTRNLGVNGVVERVVEPMMEELLNDPVLDPVTLEGLVNLLRVDESGLVFSIALDKVNSVWQNEQFQILLLNDIELSGAICRVVGAIFDSVEAFGAPKTVSLLKVIINSPVYPQLPSERFESMTRSLLSSLEADDDSPYQVSLSQLLEALYGGGRSIDAYRIIRIYCSIPEASLSRFYDIWTRRMVKDLNGTLEGEEASLAISSLIETVASEGLPALAESIYMSLVEGEGRIQLERKILLLLVKNLIVPLLTQNNVLLAADIEERRKVACRITIRLTKCTPSPSWGVALTSLVGALIRTASERQNTLVLVFEALSECVIAQTTLLKPFHPQLQRIFSNALSIESIREVAVNALCALLPALSRPEVLLQELLTLAEGATIVMDEERNSSCIPDDGNVEVRLAALEVLTRSKVKIEPIRLVQVIQVCMADNDSLIRDAGSLWIKELLSSNDEANTCYCSPSDAIILRSLLALN